MNSLARGLAILETFAQKGYSLSLAQLARELGLPKSTVHRLVQTLTQLGYLHQPVKGGDYFLAPPVLKLGFACLQGIPVREAALPHLEELFQRLGENVNLSVLGRDEVIYVARFQKREVLSLNLQVGSRLPLYSSSPGRVLAAYLPEQERRTLLERLYAQPEAASWLKDHGCDLAAVLEEVRAQGYATNDGEYLPELWAMAAPVLDPRGQAQAAVSVALLKGGRSGEEIFQRVSGPLLECARRISSLLGTLGVQQ